MKYEVQLARSARKELQKLSQSLQARIIEVLEELELNPRPRGCKKIVGGVSLWRVRSGDYRIIYCIDDDLNIVDVNAVRHRSDAYR